MSALPAAAAAEAVARELHRDPEPSLQEFRASKRCQDLLRARGFTVEAPVAGLATAFVARATLGDGAGPHLGVSVEFDALPEVGHGCGHHLIAGATLEAALRIKEHAFGNGTLTVLGTPAEEIFAGKRKMIDAGLFSGVDAVLTYHPSDLDGIFASMAGAALLELTFTGRSAHAGSTPWNGRSAQDGATLAAHGLALERQYMQDGCRIHPIVTEVKGSHNVLPDRATMLVNVRAPDLAQLERLITRTREVAAGCARATDTTVTAEVTQRADPFVADPGLADLAWDVMKLPRGSERRITGSSDLGDVSQVVPTLCTIRSGWTPVVWHSRALHDAAGTDGAYAAMHRAADDLVEVARRIFAGERPWKRSVPS